MTVGGKIGPAKKPSVLSIENFYDLVPKKFQDEPRTYPNFDEVQIKIPFRAVLTGCTGSGKTNALLRLFAAINAFDKVYLYAKDLTETLYQYWADAFEQAEKTSGAQIFTKSNDLNTLPEVSTHNKKLNTLLIFDDMITEKQKDLAKVEKYWIMGRKMHCSSVILTQSYFHAPILIRKNSELFFFTKLRTDRDLCFIMKDFQLGVSEDKILELYKQATARGYPDFFLIDTETKDPRYRFRKNFEPMGLITNEPVKLIEHADDDSKKKKRKRDDDEEESSNDEGEDEIIPENETDKQRVKRFATPVKRAKKELSPAQLEEQIQAGHHSQMDRVLSQGIKNKVAKPTISARLKSLSVLLGKSVSQLKAMGKSMGLTNKQLCATLEKSIQAGEFDDLILKEDQNV